MLASNNPYRRVDDGIGSGMISGAVVGAAALGGFHAGGRKMARAISANPISGRKGIGIGTSVAEHHGKFRHMNGRGKAISYGASALAGSILGGAIDAYK